MQWSYGEGGWVAVDDVGLPGPLYVQFRQAERRLEIAELYLDGSAGAISSPALRSVPISELEAYVNADDSAFAERWRARLHEPGPDLSTLASYYAGVGTPRHEAREVDGGNWVAASFAAQRNLPDPDATTRPPLRSKQTYLTEKETRVFRPGRARRRWEGIGPDDQYRLEAGPSQGLTDAFLHDVARAYSAAVARGERPNVAISDQTDYPLKSVQRWVYTARQRGIMPAGRRGRVG